MNRFLICLLVCIILCACSNGNYSSLSSTSQSTIKNASQFNSSNFQLFNTDAETGFIRPDGRRVVLSEKYDDIFPFSDNRCVVLKDRKLGVIDDEGNSITELKFDYDYGNSTTKQPQFIDGRLEVVLLNHYNKQYYKDDLNISSREGIIDINGNYIIEPIYDNIVFDSQTSLYLVKDMFWKHGALTQNGEIAIPVIYDEIEHFDENDRAKVRIGNKWGHINDSNKIIIPIEYSKISNFNEKGLAIATKTLIEFARNDIGLNGFFEFQNSDGSIYSEVIINKEGKVLYDLSNKLILALKEDEQFERGGIRLLDNGMAEVPVYEGLNTIKFDINGLWGQPEYAPFLGDYALGKSIEDTPVPPVHYGQFQNEPIYEVLVWDDSIKYELIDLNKTAKSEASSQSTMPLSP